MNTLPYTAVCLRLEQPSDISRVRHIDERAFEGRVEADLVDALRTAGGVTLSAVAVLGGRDAGGEGAAAAHRSQMCSGEVVGHALSTPVTVPMENKEISLLGLGPVAVLPARQHQGIGTPLIAGCLEHLRTSGHKGVVVVGESGYYRRFGFIPAAR